jgi:membrane protein DedA with SNARE-associated domain
MNVMEGLLHFITGFGWLAVLLVIFAESGLMVGFFLPGDSLLFIAGNYIVEEEPGEFVVYSCNKFNETYVVP